MKPKASRSKTILTKLVAVVILALLVVAAVKCANGASLANTAWSLLPPVIAIVLALITKEAYSALFIGVLVGSLFTCGFAPVATLDTILNDGLITAISANAGIFLFLVLLGIIVALVNAAGGSAAFGRWAETHIKTHAGAQLATFVLGILIFIDDYFNCLTVGSVMRPVTDSHKISRPKLAYLIDATAAPVCMIAPISSWAAAVSSTAEGLDTGMSGIELFVKAIPYNLYSILTFVFILAIIAMKLDYGPMRKFEAKAAKGDLSALVEEAGESANPNGRVIDLILPVLALIVTCTIGMIYVGGFFGADMSGDPSFAGDFIGAFGNTERLRRSAVGRYHRAGADGYLSRRAEGSDLQGGHGLRAQGLYCHGPADHHPDAGRLAEGHDQRPWRGCICLRSDVRRFCVAVQYAARRHFRRGLHSGLCLRHKLGHVWHSDPDRYRRLPC